MKKNLLLAVTLSLLVATLCKAQSPTLWGVTNDGGSLGKGTIFKTNTTGATFTNNYDFYLKPNAPAGGLIQAGNGLLYGTTSGGGISTADEGTIYSYNIATDSVTYLHYFGNGSDGRNPYGSLLQASDSLLYGLTAAGGLYNLGTLFSYNIATGVETDLHNFGNGTDGQSPHGSLIQASNGLLYGMTVNGGADSAGIIFSYNISTGVETDLVNFNYTNGAKPFGSLLEYRDSLLYGLTSRGGGGDSAGVIFCYNINSGKDSVLPALFNGYYGYQPYGSLMLASDGNLYGVTSSGGKYDNGEIFYCDPSTNSSSVYYNIEYGDQTPLGTPFEYNKILYVLISEGGSNNGGDMFYFNFSTGTHGDEHSFCCNGIGPVNTPVKAKNGLFYGTTLSTGANGNGTIYSFNSALDTLIDLFDFNSGHDGAQPMGQLVKGPNGLLYGMTTHGGAYGYGTIYTYNIATGQETDIHDFGSGNDGRWPAGSLMMASDSNFYALTPYGGLYNIGAIIGYNPVKDSEFVAYSFTGPTGPLYDGEYPYGNLMEASPGKLFGVCTMGGIIGYGTVFRYTIGCNCVYIVYNIEGWPYDVAGPTGKLVLAPDGYYYGTGPGGGPNGYGGIFATNIIGAENMVHNFGNGNDGYNPCGSIIMAPNDSIVYGMTTNGGVNGYGMMYSFNINSAAYTDLFDFLPGSGTNPMGSLLQLNDSILYGMTSSGGSGDSGIIFSFNLNTNKEKVIHNFSGLDGNNPIGDLMVYDSVYTSVWPGDANDDLTVNNYDLLPIGLYYNTTGPARDTALNTWAAHPALDWDSLQINGRNLKFVDCNGDGTINSDDTFAVALNYGDTHLYYSPFGSSGGTRSIGVPLYFVADSTLYLPGDNVHLAVWLGTSSAPATDMYGLAYDIDLDNSQIQPGTVSFNYANSFLGTKNSDAISLSHIGNDVEAAVVRTDHHNKNGYGKIGDLYFTLNATITNPQIVFTVSSFKAIDSAGNILTVQPANDTLAVNTTTGANRLSATSNRLLIYPNPASNQLTILSNQSIKQITITNLLGQIIYKSPIEDLGTTKQILTVSSLPDGLYFIIVTTDNGICTEKFVVSR